MLQAQLSGIFCFQSFARQDQLVTSDKSKKSSIAVVKNRLTCPMVKGMTFELLGSRSMSWLSVLSGCLCKFVSRPFRVFQKDEFRSQMRAGQAVAES